MDSGSQFWWNWVVNFLMALTTFLAVVVALFGDRIRTLLFRPALGLRLANALGEKTPIDLGSIDEHGQQKARRGDARFYHLRISNDRRWPVATEVQVQLLRVEERGPDGVFRAVWVGDVPLRWRHQEIHSLMRTIGHNADCDLCSVVKDINDKWLALLPLIVPHNLKTQYRGPTVIQLVLQARAVETDSNLLHIEIVWDGQWADGENEMSRHMIVKELPSA